VSARTYTDALRVTQAALAPCGEARCWSTRRRPGGRHRRRSYGLDLITGSPAIGVPALVSDEDQLG
jgi:hypothetical protein